MKTIFGIMMIVFLVLFAGYLFLSVSNALEARKMLSEMKLKLKELNLKIKEIELN